MTRTTTLAWFATGAFIAVAGLASTHIKEPLRAQASAAFATVPETGQVSGTVVAASTGGPIRGATVSLSNVETSDPGFVTRTDHEGRFRFDAIPAGRYHLGARQPGFLSVTLGQKRPGSGGDGVAIQITDGQRVDRLMLSMPRGAAISGVVLDPFGDPALGSLVTVLRYTSALGQRMLTSADTAVTDERGMYRIPQLPPGNYIVKATPPGSTDGFNGSPASIYHPGTTSISAATVVAVDISEERSGIDVFLHDTATHRVTGMIVDPQGRPPARPLIIAIAGVDEAGEFDTGTQVVDGRFTFEGLRPGRYRISALAGSGVHGMVPDMPAPLADTRDDGPALWAQEEVTVLDRDVTDIRMSLQPGSDIAGRVVRDDGAPLPDLANARVRVVPATPRAMWRTSPGAVIGANGAFKIPGVPPGRYRFELDGAGPGSSLRSAIIEGRDTLDSPLEVTPEAAITGVVLTIRLVVK